MRVSSLNPEPCKSPFWPFNCPKSAPSVDHTLKLPNPNETSSSKACPLVVGNVWCTTFRTSHYTTFFWCRCYATTRLPPQWDTTVGQIRGCWVISGWSLCCWVFNITRSYCFRSFHQNCSGKEQLQNQCHNKLVEIMIFKVIVWSFQERQRVFSVARILSLQCTSLLCVEVGSFEVEPSVLPASHQRQTEQAPEWAPRHITWNLGVRGIHGINPHSI